MRNLADCRIVEIKIADVWTPVHWEQLDEGDIIRFRNPDGSEPQHCYAGEQIVLHPLYLKTKSCMTVGEGSERINCPDTID